MSYEEDINQIMFVLDENNMLFLMRRDDLRTFLERVLLNPVLNYNYLIKINSDFNNLDGIVILDASDPPGPPPPPEGGVILVKLGKLPQQDNATNLVMWIPRVMVALPLLRIAEGASPVQLQENHIMKIARGLLKNLSDDLSKYNKLDDTENKKKGGKKRSSSTTRKSSSSRRRRSAKKRGTQRKQKRRQRRASRRA